MQSGVLRGFVRGVVMLSILVGACNPEANQHDRQKKKKVETLADLGALPLSVTDPHDNPTTPEKVHLGSWLFFVPILSGIRVLAWAPCHTPDFEFAEFLQTSIAVIGVRGGGARNLKEPITIR